MSVLQKVVDDFLRSFKRNSSECADNKIMAFERKRLVIDFAAPYIMCILRITRCEASLVEGKTVKVDGFKYLGEVLGVGAWREK